MNLWSVKAAFLVWCLAGCTATSGYSVADTLSLQELPINQNRVQVMADAPSLWASAPDCSTQRTGYANNRRAWFLETCTFSNSGTNSILKEIPATVSYHFLEDRLVQVDFLFSSFSNLSQFKQQIQESSNTASEEESNVSAKLDMNRTLRVFNTMATQIHALRSPR